MFKRCMALFVLLSLTFLTGCVFNKPPTFKGVEIRDLYEAMPATKVILLNGNYKHDEPSFNLAYPHYLSLKADAEAEGTSVVFIRADNYFRDQESIVRSLGIDEYWEFLRQNNVLARANQTERHLEIGFCKDPSSVNTGHNYFYCFGYNGAIYKVITKVDVLDRQSGRIKRAWVYTPYKAGMFTDFFVPGPYGILPKPAISGKFYEPRVFID